MGTPRMPYESGHPQFDPEAHAQWQELKRREPYLEDHGLVFVRPEPSRISNFPRRREVSRSGRA